MPTKETLKQANMEHVKTLGYGKHLLLDKDLNICQIWQCNKNHASYGLKYKNTHLEYCRSVSRCENSVCL